MPLKAVFLDRDGTLILEKNYVYRKEDLSFLPGAIAALRILADKAIKIFIITNQAGIAKGYYTEQAYFEFTKFMVTQLEHQGIFIDEILHCPHHPEGVVIPYNKACDCRKPGTKNIKLLLEKYKIKPEESAFIGDNESDIEAGYTLGMKTYLVMTGHGATYAPKTKADFIVCDLFQAVNHLIKSNPFN